MGSLHEAASTECIRKLIGVNDLEAGVRIHPSSLALLGGNAWLPGGREGGRKVKWKRKKKKKEEKRKKNRILGIIDKKKMVVKVFSIGGSSRDQNSCLAAARENPHPCWSLGVIAEAVNVDRSSA